MTIKVYPSIYSDDPVETHEFCGTLAEWVKQEGLCFDEACPLIVVDGVERYDLGTIDCSADVRITAIPQGGIISGIGNLIGAILDFALGWLLPSVPGARGAPEAGQSLEAADAKANSVRLGQAVPELAGRFRRYPDYITPPRRHYTSRREQWLEFMVCIGPGEYEIQPDDIMVGETPVGSLGDDAEFTLFQPGDDVSANTAHEVWFSAAEVGGTSSGSAGLELSTEVGNRVNTQPASYTFDGLTIERSDGEYPPAWGNGTTVKVEYPRTYDVQTVLVVNPIDPEDYYNISEITGYFGHVDLTVGQYIQLGRNSDPGRMTYRIHSVVGNTIQLWNDVYEPFGPVILSPTGMRELVFGANVDRTINTSTEDEITLNGPLTFETGVTITNANIAFSGGRAYGEYTSEYVGVPNGEQTDTYEIDINFPNGLGEIKDSSEVGTRSVTIELQRRNLDTNNIVTTFYTYTDNTLDHIGITETISLSTPGRWAFRMRRANAEATSPSIRDVCQWSGLKSKLSAPSTYPDWTTMAVRLRSGDRIGAQSENKINVIATRKLPTLNPGGTWSAPVATRDISAFVRHIATTVGYVDADLDIEELLELHNLWTARGDTFNHVFSETTVKQALNTVLQAGMAEFTVSDGLITPTREGVRTIFEQSYSPRNMTSDLSRTFTGRRHDDNDGVEIEYTQDGTWTKETVICALPSSARLKLRREKLDGVTNKTQAWRIGMRRAREIMYRRWEYSFQTISDALNSNYNSYVGLFDEIPTYSQSALLIDHAGDVFVASEKLKWLEGETHLFAFRREDGTLAGPWTATRGSNDFEIVATVTEPVPSLTLMREPTHIYFGPSSTWVFPAIVKSISPSGGFTNIQVSAVNYDARIYADDDNTPTE